MIFPTKQKFPISQNFGENPDIYKQFGLIGHNGIDIATPSGTPILASISGTVIEAVKSGDVGYGKYVKIENDQYGSLTAHLSRVDVEVGQQVTEGQQIGLSGNTGFSIGPHLHWGIFTKPRDKTNGYNGYVDQTSFITTPNADTVAVNKKDYEALITKLDNQTQQIHELGVERDSLKAKADNLGVFLENLANKLGTPKEQSSIMGAIEEVLSTGESIKSLTGQLANLNKFLTEKNETIASLSLEREASRVALELVTGQFTKLQKEYQDLVAVTPKPSLKFKIGRYTIEVWK